MKTWVKVLIGVAAVLLVIGIIFGSIYFSGRNVITVQTGKAQNQNLASVVTASGEIKPKTYVNVGANAFGKIIHLYVKEGDRVKKGAMLAHQIHGAIGVTLEYPLARLSRNMWRWSDEFGGQRHWAVTIGRASLGATGAWDAVIAASDPVGATDRG